MKRNKIATLINFSIFTILPLFSTSLLSVFILKHQSSLLNFGVKEWLLFSIVFAFASALALCPPTFLAVIMGYFISFYAIPYLLIVNIGAIFLVYFFAKFLNFNWAKAYLNQNEKAIKVLKALKTNELKIILFTKLSPILPFALTNLVFAISGAKLKNILVGGFLGMIPRTLIAVYSGSQVKEIHTLMTHHGDGLVSKILIVILVIISIWGGTLAVKKALMVDL